EVGRTEDGAGPDRGVEGGEQDADDGGVDPAERTLKAGVCPQQAPEGERGEDKQERWQEDRDQPDRGAEHAVRLRSAYRSEVGRECEERPRDRLRGTVAGDELPVGQPAGRD